MMVEGRPQQIRDAVFDDLIKHFSEEQIVEFTLRTALCGFFNVSTMPYRSASRPA